MADDAGDDGRSVISFDKFKLDEELERQPGLYLEYADRQAEAEGLVSQADAILDLTKAKISLAVRMDPGKFGLKSKPNNDEVEAAVISSQMYQDALKKLNRRKLRVGKLKAIVRAIEHRKSSVEKSVDLFLAGYFADRPRNRNNPEMAKARMRQAFAPDKPRKKQ